MPTPREAIIEHIIRTTFREYQQIATRRGCRQTVGFIATEAYVPETRPLAAAKRALYKDIMDKKADDLVAALEAATGKSVRVFIPNGFCEPDNFSVAVDYLPETITPPSRPAPPKPPVYQGYVV